MVALAVAKKVEIRKNGYMRNNKLATCGRIVMLYKIVLDCETRRTSLTAAMVRRVDTIQVLLEEFSEMTPHEIHREIQTQRKDFWDAQKICKERG